MANRKISQFAKIAAGSVAGDDLVTVVDVSGGATDGGNRVMEIDTFRTLVGSTEASVENAIRAEDAAAAAALSVAQAALYDGPKTDFQSELAAVTAGMLPEDDVIRVIENQHVYKRVADAATDFDVDHTGTGGLKYLALPGERGYSLAQFESPLAAISVTAGVPSATGGDASDAIDALFSRAIKEASGGAHLNAGIYRASGSITLPNASGGTVAKDRVGFKVQGAGRANQWPFGEGGHTPAGTVLFIDPGKQLILPNGRTATMFEDLTIVGSSNGDALINDQAPKYNGFATNGGGFKNVTIINDHKTAPAAGTYLMTTTALYGCLMQSSFMYGRSDPKTAWDSDAATAIEDLYHGGGWWITCEGEGAQGVISGITHTGFDVGVEIGFSLADWSDTGTIDDICYDSHQFSYSNVGLNYKRGLRSLILRNSHFEFNTRAGVWTHSGSGALMIDGGGGGQAIRTATGGNEYISLGTFVCGDADPAEHEYGPVIIQNHSANIATQPVAFAFGGDGQILIDRCYANNNGGYLLAFDAATVATRGYPEFLIRDYMGTGRLGGSKLDATRIASLVTNTDDNTQHAYVSDARFYGRIEGGGADAEGDPYAGNILMLADIDFGVRKLPPFNCHMSTTARTITLGDAAYVAMPMRLERRNAGGGLSVVIPTGTIAYIDGVSTGPSTVAITGTGVWEFTRLSNGRWNIRKV